MICSRNYVSGELFKWNEIKGFPYARIRAHGYPMIRVSMLIGHLN